MPAPQKVAWSRLRVGITAVVAMLILGVLIFLLSTSGNIFKRKAILYTYMEDASGTQESVTVRLNGIPIGNVKRIDLSGDPDPRRAVRMTLEIRSEFLDKIPQDSVAMISASNLLGDKFINITRGNPKLPHVKDEGELRSAQIQDVPELMAESANVLATFQNVLKRLDTLVGGIEAGQGNIGKFLKDEELYDRLNAIAAESQKILSDVRNGKGTLSHILYDDTLYQQFNSSLRRVDDLLDGLQKGQGTAGKFLRDPALWDDLHQTLAEIHTLVNNVNAGKGTVGKLLHDDQLNNQFNQLTAKLNSIVDRINSGQGTIGQLLTNPQLAEALTGLTQQMQSLVRDMHANPKKFLTIQLKLF